MAPADTGSDFFHLGAVAGVLAATAGLFASVVQNLMFAFKTRREISRQEKLDRWAREDTIVKLKDLEEKLKEAIKKYEEHELLYKDSCRELEDSKLRERTANLVIDRLLSSKDEKEKINPPESQSH
jgi:hypothetical protein